MAERNVEVLYMGKRSDITDRSIDIRFWQQQSDQARWDATWELIALAHKMKTGKDLEPRLDRTATTLGRKAS